MPTGAPIIMMWEGMGLQITEPMVPLFPPCSYAEFPTRYCGAGNGWGERMVPDYVFSFTRCLPGPLNIAIKISPACYIHDLDYQFAAPTWEAFHAANSRFYANIKAIVDKQAQGYPAPLLRQAMRYPEVYAQAVDTIGRPVFWSIKRDEGHLLPASAEWILA